MEVRGWCRQGFGFYSETGRASGYWSIQDSNGIRLTDKAIWSEVVWRKAAAFGGRSRELPGKRPWQ